MRITATLALALTFVAAIGSAHAQSRGYGGFGSGYGTGSNPRSNSVDGYTRSDGTYVAPHQRTNPNSTQSDNYGTRGNQNPYTGTYGTNKPRW
jgi:hypothetical protein